VAGLAASLFVVLMLYLHVEVARQPSNYLRSRAGEWVLSGDQHLFDVSERTFDVRRLDGFSEGRRKYPPLGVARSRFQPHFVKPAGNAIITGDEFVLGVLNGSTPTAYPLRVLAVHQVVTDSTQDPPVLAYFGLTTHSAAAYTAVLDDRNIQLASTGLLYLGVDLLFDFATESLFLPVSGSFVAGDLLAQRLELLPSAVVTLDDWLALFPDSRIMTTNTGIAGKSYAHIDMAAKGTAADAGRLHTVLRGTPDCIALFSSTDQWKVSLLELPAAAKWRKGSREIAFEGLSGRAHLGGTAGSAFFAGADGAVLPAVRMPVVVMMELEFRKEVARFE
jgi:hypothetical protein